MSEIKNCDACGVSVTCVGHRDFGQNHRCSAAGLDASDADHVVCPVHKTLVWVVGPYSTFRACGNRNCTAGKRGKPHRYCAPRGGSKGETEAPEATPVRDVPGFPPTEEGQRNPYPTEITAPQTTAPSERKVPVTTATAIDLKSLGAFGDAIQTYVDARASEIATDIAVEAIAKLGERGPSQIEWKVNGQPFAKIDGAHHKALPRMLKLYAAGFRNFLIVGPAGSGKTTLARDMAKALEIEFGSVSCTAGMSESALTGRAIPNLSTGETSFQSTLFVDTYEHGGVFLVDEVDAADPNVMLAINSALANGHMPLPNRDSAPIATRHDSCVIVCAANTWGTGADRQYVGRNQLDAAFLDRFVGCTIEVDYDRDLEASLVNDAHICARVWSIRDKVAELKMRRVVGTRFLLAVVRLVKGAGETIDTALRGCTVGWTTDELTRIGVR